MSKVCKHLPTCFSLCFDSKICFRRVSALLYEGTKNISPSQMFAGSLNSRKINLFFEKNKDPVILAKFISI